MRGSLRVTHVAAALARASSLHHRSGGRHGSSGGGGRQRGSGDAGRLLAAGLCASATTSALASPEPADAAGPTIATTTLSGELRGMAARANADYPTSLGALHARRSEEAASGATPPPGALGLRPPPPPSHSAGSVPASSRMQGLPVYRAADVAAHRDAASRIWVTYEGGVYDITDFVAIHPGGSARILLAAGGDVGPYWRVYAQHQKQYVQELLERYKVGLLHPDDVAAAAALAVAGGAGAGAGIGAGAGAGVGGAGKGTPADPYAADPPRHPALAVRSARPFNAEPPGPLLVDSYLTPVDLFFVRNHMPVPTVDEKSYRLEIFVEGMGEVEEEESAASGVAGDGKSKKPSSRRPVASLSLDDLKTRFPRVEVTMALQCAGNRRADMSAARTARGLGWATGAIANGTWAGARLRDVLREAVPGGFDADAAVRDGKVSVGGTGGGAGRSVAHLRMMGLDADTVSGSAAADSGYSASVPLDLALDPRGDAILAWEMNGQPLTRDHGFPLRAVFPGIVGARQVKWLGRIDLSSEESESVWQRRDYKAFPPWQDWDTVDYASMPPMMDMPVASAIADPPPPPPQPPPSKAGGGGAGAPAPSAAVTFSFAAPPSASATTAAAARLGAGGAGAGGDGDESVVASSVVLPTVTVPLRGWAWAGGGRGISRVEWSADGGRTWSPAEITDSPPDASPSRTRSWGWTLWRADAAVPPAVLRQAAREALEARRKGEAAAVGGAGAAAPSAAEATFCVRAMDVACNTQASDAQQVWNWRGLANNSYHSVRVSVGATIDE